MADFHTTLFDTWQPGTTANEESLLFQTPRGGDATHNERFTNMRGAGNLPSEEAFAVENIGVMIDENIPDSDLDVFLYGALLELRLKDKVVFSCPPLRCMIASGRGGVLAQAVAADVEFAGPIGDGFQLRMPIAIPGGTRFDVRAVSGAALTAAQDFKLILEGILTTPT